MTTISIHFLKISFTLALAASLLFPIVTVLNSSAAGTLPNGVAAGDTTQTTAVLWARGTATGTVAFEYTTDASFSTGLLTVTTTISNVLQPAKVELSGLSSATTYFYRATDAVGASASGQFRTAANLGPYRGFRFGVSGDWEPELAPYPSLNNADERNLDLFVEHGDTIVAGMAITTTEAYRLKHNEVYSTYFGLNTWADLRASTSILAIIDDNDVQNNFAGGADPTSDDDFDNNGNFINETNRYQNALQAFQEYNPVRSEFYDDTGDNRTANKRKLYRFRTYGRDAAIFLLDTRSFRDAQLDSPMNISEVPQFLQNTFDPNRTILGQAQLAQLKEDLQQAQDDGISWKFILTPSPIQNLGIPKAEDRFEGYAAERTDLLRFIEQNGIENVVFVAAGLHGTIVNNLTYQEETLGAQTPVKAFEIIVGPVAVDPPSGPFGPEVVDLALSGGLITQAEKDVYDNQTRVGKDQFVKTLLNDEIITPSPLNYDPIGLEGSTLDAVLLEGDYVSLHTYGWTEFGIDEETQILTVTTFGIDSYTEAELMDNPNDVISRTPTIVSQFAITPTLPILKRSIYLPTLLKN